ncbi:MAG: hypothetical protein F6J87_08715, partial [Spirulina sp. SIO3F2]|nr:hypothetical protein [Spirulina sp. SIO3F2]
ALAHLKFGDVQGAKLVIDTINSEWIYTEAQGDLAAYLAAQGAFEQAWTLAHQVQNVTVYHGHVVDWDTTTLAQLDAFVKISRAYVEAGAGARARQLLEQIVTAALEAQYIRYLPDVAQLYLQLEAPEKAREVLELATQPVFHSKPDFDRSWVIRDIALAYWQLGDIEASQTWFELVFDRLNLGDNNGTQYNPEQLQREIIDFYIETEQFEAAYQLALKSLERVANAQRVWLAALAVGEYALPRQLLADCSVEVMHQGFERLSDD